MCGIRSEMGLVLKERKSLILPIPNTHSAPGFAAKNH